MGEIHAGTIGVFAGSAPMQSERRRAFIAQDRRVRPSAVRRELVEFIKDLDADEAAALVALAWIGRGDMQPAEWKIAVARAKERAEGPTWRYVLEMELLPDSLEDALSAFGRSCEGLGSADEG